MHNNYLNVKHMLAVLTVGFTVSACGQAEDTSAPSDAAAAVETTATEMTTAAPQADPSGGETATFGDLVYGSADAPIEIIEYASLTCPHCATFANTVFPQVKEKYIDTGKVRFVYRNFIMNRVDLAASTIARCGDDENTKKVMKALFEKQDAWLRAENPMDGLAGMMRRLGMSRTKFDRCMSNTEMHKALVQMTQDGQSRYNVAATPTIIVNGAKVDRPMWEDVDQAIQDNM